jgi:hypothetical protein
MPTWRRAELAPGTYDELISARLERLLAGLDPQLNIHRKPVARTEAISVLIESLLGEAIDLALSELKVIRRPRSRLRNGRGALLDR